MEYENKNNSELVKILNDLSEENDKIKKEVEKLLLVTDDIEIRYNYIQELIKKRMKRWAEEIRLHHN